MDWLGFVMLSDDRASEMTTLAILDLLATLEEEKIHLWDQFEGCRDTADELRKLEVAAP
jgi:hypothetical protein